MNPKKQKNYKPVSPILFVLVFFTHLGLLGQEGPKFWSGYSVGANLDRTWSVRAGQTYLFDNSLGLRAVQNGAGINYRVNKKLSLGLGYIYSTNSADPDQPARNRLDPRIEYNVRLGKLRIGNRLRTEWHFPERSKFEYRLRYALQLHAGNFGLPLKATPYISNEFHYYLGGSPLQYRDETGEKVVKQSPDGLHAHRIRAGIRFKPFKRAYAGISYMRQTEFNIGDKYRELNVTDPRTGRISRPFNNFSAVTFNFSYRFKL